MMGLGMSDAPRFGPSRVFVQSGAATVGAIAAQQGYRSLLPSVTTVDLIVAGLRALCRGADERMRLLR